MKQIWKTSFISLTTILFLFACNLGVEEKKETKYTVTTSVTPLEGGTVALSNTEVKSGDTVTLTATPKKGYNFVKWSGDHSGTERTTTITVKKDLNITAEFKLKPVTYKLTTQITPNISWGSIDRSINKTEYSSGEKVTLTAIPTTGYSFIRWEGEFNSNDSNTAVVVMDRNKVVTGVFAEVTTPTYNITVLADSSMGSATSSPQIVVEGESTIITATAKTGFRFTGWSGDATGSANPLTITNITADKTVTANFEALPTYTITANSLDTTMGTASANATTVYEGESATITATPKTGYRFTGWSGDATGSANPLTITNITANKSVTANFEALPTYTITVNSSNTTMGTASANATTVYEGESITLTSTPKTGYEFTNWSGDSTSAVNPLTITNITANKTFTANFQVKSYDINATSNNTTYGTVASTSATATHGGNVTLTATPKAGYAFKGWSGDATGMTNPLTITNITSAKNIQAKFGKKWSLLVHFAVDNDIDYKFEKNFGTVSNYLNTLKNIETKDSNDNIQIYLFFDGYNNASYDAAMQMPIKDGYYKISGTGTIADDLVQPVAEINSGNINDSKAFIDWAMSGNSSTNFIYSVFNHGGGFNDLDINTNTTYGIGFDDSHEQDALSHDELSRITTYLKGKIGKNIDLFYPYACLMGGVELAYEVKNSADYILFSEELFPAEHWSYEALSSITSNEFISVENIGKSFCDSAKSYFTSRDFTLSIVNLSRIDNLYSAIDSYAIAAINEINTNPGSATAFNSAALSSLKMMEDSLYYYIDLGDYLTEVGKTGLPISIKTSAATVTTALNSAVVYHTNNNMSRATGMTIYHNIWKSTSSYTDNMYKTIIDFGSNKWTDYMNLMNNSSLGTITPDSLEANDTLGTATTLTNLSGAQTVNLHSGTDIDVFKISYSTGQKRRFEVKAIDGGASNINIGIFNSAGLIGELTGFNSFSLDGLGFPSGDYFFAILPAGEGVRLGDYQVNYYTTAPLSNDIYEPNNYTYQATDLSDGEKQNHTLTSGDVDYFRINLQKGTNYIIQTSPSIVGVDTDTNLELRDSSGTTILLSNDNISSTNKFSGFGFTSPDTGTFYLKVTSVGGSTGEYCIVKQNNAFNNQVLESNTYDFLYK